MNDHETIQDAGYSSVWTLREAGRHGVNHLNYSVCPGNCISCLHRKWCAQLPGDVPDDVNYLSEPTR